jgi:DNA-binding transcriptional regulator YhcF (GntR family)
MSIADAHRALPSIALTPSSQEPVGRQIYRQLRQLILHGRLPARARLPSTRQLASDLGVSRNIVVFAYEELKAEGYILSEVGAGSRVASPVQRGPLDRRSPRERRQPVRAGNLPPSINEPGYRIGQPFEGPPISNVDWMKPCSHETRAGRTQSGVERSQLLSTAAPAETSFMPGSGVPPYKIHRA